jgi:hypothetical protein
LTKAKKTNHERTRKSLSPTFNLPKATHLEPLDYKKLPVGLSADKLCLPKRTLSNGFDYIVLFHRAAYNLNAAEVHAPGGVEVANSPNEEAQ